MTTGNQVRIRQDGRGGTVELALAAGVHRFDWEFGGGNCIAFIHVPDRDSWARIPVLAGHPRAATLQFLADEVARRQCAGARIVISENWIEFHR